MSCEKCGNPIEPDVMVTVEDRRAKPVLFKRIHFLCLFHFDQLLEFFSPVAREGE